MRIDQAIARAIQESCNLCFVITGGRGSGKDYCLLGGSVPDAARNESIINVDPSSVKTREPGLIRLAFETIIAQICINNNAQFSVQIAAGLIQDELFEDLQKGDAEMESYSRAGR